MSLTVDAYGHSVSMTTDGTTDTYLVGGALTYSFPAGTSNGVVAVTLAIQANLIIFNQALTDYINGCYSNEMRLRWVVMFLEFQAFSQPNKLAYVQQLLSWSNDITTYAGTYIASVVAMTNPSTIVSTKFEQSQFSADPGLTVLACMQIVG